MPELVVDAGEDAGEPGIALEDVELLNEPAEESPAGARSHWTGMLDRLCALGRPPASR